MSSSGKHFIFVYSSRGFHAIQWMIFEYCYNKTYIVNNMPKRVIQKIFFGFDHQYTHDALCPQAKSEKSNNSNIWCVMNFLNDILYPTGILGNSNSTPSKSLHGIFLEFTLNNIYKKWKKMSGKKNVFLIPGFNFLIIRTFEDVKKNNLWFQKMCFWERQLD